MASYRINLWGKENHDIKTLQIKTHKNITEIATKLTVCKLQTNYGEIVPKQKLYTVGKSIYLFSCRKGNRNHTFLFLPFIFFLSYLAFVLTKRSQKPRLNSQTTSGIRLVRDCVILEIFFALRQEVPKIVKWYLRIEQLISYKNKQENFLVFGVNIFTNNHRVLNIWRTVIEYLTFGEQWHQICMCCSVYSFIKRTHCSIYFNERC